MNKPEYTDQLASINASVLAPGETLPIVQLRNGSKVQTGTVATMLRNVGRYNAGDHTVLHELELAVPTLVAVGLFDLFSPEEWINGGNPGRAVVGQMARDFLARGA
jgi:hypothetical protein